MISLLPTTTSKSSIRVKQLYIVRVSCWLFLCVLFCFWFLEKKKNCASLLSRVCMRFRLKKTFWILIHCLQSPKNTMLQSIPLRDTTTKVIESQNINSTNAESHLHINVEDDTNQESKPRQMGQSEILKPRGYLYIV